MRKLLIICVAVLQVLLLAFMAGQREYVLRTGRTVYLRTVPVDPRDFFRGDYVRLRYEISNVAKEYFRDGLAAEAKDTDSRRYRDRPVYVVLKVDDSNLADIDYVTDKKPRDGKLYIRGRRDYICNGSLDIRYGIEAYFVEQGKGEQLERRRFSAPDEAAVSLEMKVALGSNGIAVINGYRRPPVAIKVENIEPRNGPIQSCRLKLINVSDKPVAIVDLPDNGSLKLEIDSQRWYQDRNLRWANDNILPKTVEDKDIHTLQPNQSYEFNINFNAPYWSVIEKEDKPIPINQLKSARWDAPYFNLVYQPPSKEQCKVLKDADLIWHGKAVSNSFRGNTSQD
jgi:uncharacterized membrane-anchored protein